MNTINRPFQIRIIDQGEIRMGSPYHSCEIQLIGFDKVQIPKYGGQDKYAWSDDSKNLVLIQYDLKDNEPGFHFFIIDTETGMMRESERIFGLVNAIAIEENKIKYSKFLLDRTKSKPGDLCCHTDEEYILT